MERKPSTTVIVITAHATVETAVDAMRRGAFDFITKPVSWGTLPYRIQFILRAKQALNDASISEGKTRALLAGIPDIILRINRDGFVIDMQVGAYVNEMEEWVVYDPATGEGHLPGPVYRILAPQIRRVFAGKGEQLVEFEWSQAQQKRRTWEARVILREQNEVVMVIRDITLRKQQEAELRAATAALNNASEARDGGTGSQTIDWIEVRAKEPGVVESLAVTDGTFVEATTLLLTTINPDMVRFRAMALQSDLLKFKSGQSVRIVPPQANGSEMNESIEAALVIGLDADPIQRTVPLFATPKEIKSWSLAGVSAFLEIATESSDGVVLAIPRSSVVKDGITHVFFKRDPGNTNKAIRVEADLGVDDGRWIEIKSGVGPNDEVVLNGAYELKLATAMSGTSQKGGHFHADGTYHGKH